MDPATIALETFGVGSLIAAFAKYTIDRRKTMQTEDNMKNHELNFSLKHGINNSPIS
jgi:hypothetical protein